MTKAPRKGIGFMIARIFASFFFFIIAQVVAAITSLLLDSVINPYILGILVSGLGIALFTLLLWLYLHFVEHRTLSDIGLICKPRNILNIVFGLLLGAIAILLAAIPLYLTDQYRISFASPNIGAAVLGLLFFIFVGFNEELLSRGAMQHGLLRFGPIVAVSAASIIFSLLHLANPGFTLLPFLNIVLAGLFMGVAVYATGDIWASIGIHITWNWIQGSILGIPVSGTVPNGLFTTSIVGTNPLWTGASFGVEGSLTCTIVLVILIIVLFLVGKSNGKYRLYLDKTEQERG